MERVVKFVNDRFRHAGNSIEVQNQKEELIASLHDRVYDAMAAGKNEDQAFDQAVSTLGDLSELTELLDGSHRTVAINKLNRDHALFVYLAIALELLVGGVLYLLIPATHSTTGGTTPTLIGLGCAMFVGAVWPAITAIIYQKDPARMQKAEFNFQKYFTGAVVAWLAMSLGLAIINIAVNSTATEKVIWFCWPMIGIANWPISLLIYSWLYRKNRYEA